MTMIKNRLHSIALYCLILIITACSDSEQANTTHMQTSNNAPQKQETGLSAQKQKTTPTEPKLESNKTHYEKTFDLDSLRHAAEKARQQASARGFEWNTIQHLLDDADYAIGKGNKKYAAGLLIQAKEHAELAIKQADYAEQYWQLLMPKTTKANKK